MSTEYTIRQILGTHKITDYLAKRGVTPDSQAGDAWKYKCPIHDDSTPSFYVYADKEPQDFFCYGCKSGGSIISLKMKMEGVSGRYAINSLSEGLDIKVDDEFRFLVGELEKEKGGGGYDPDELSLLISRQVHKFLNNVEYSQPFFDRCEKLFQKVDQLVLAEDYRTVLDVYDHLNDSLVAQMDQYEAMKDEEIRNNRKSHSKVGR